MTKVTAVKPVYFNGSRFAAGQHFELSSPHLEAYIRDGLVVESGKTVEVGKVVEETFKNDAEELEVLLKAWDAVMTPTEYLKKFPDGPESDVAMRIVELVAEQAEFDQK